MTQTAPETEALIKSLRAACVDWDGSQMPDGAEPMPVTCVALRSAANALQALSAKVAELEGERDEARESSNAFEMALQELNEIGADTQRRAEIAEAQVTTLTEAVEAINVTDEELLRIRNACEHEDGQIKIWAKMLQKLIDHIRHLRAAIRTRTHTERKGQ